MLGRWSVKTIDGDHCVATWDRVLLQVWRADTTAAAIAELDRVARRFIAEEPKRISSLAIVESTSPAPSDAARTALSKFYRELAPQMNVAVVVGEGGGFRGAIVRSVGVTLSMLAPRALPFKFVGTVAEATTLVSPHLSPTAGGAAMLVQMIESLRAEIKSGARR